MVPPVGGGVLRYLANEDLFSSSEAALLLVSTKNDDLLLLEGPIF